MNKNQYNCCYALALIRLIFVISLAGCAEQQSLQTALQTYQQRMAAVLNIPAPKIITVSLSPYPSIKELKQTIPLAKIRLADFYQLKNCQLSTLIAERNTTLGRTQYPSSRYLYEVTVLQAIQQCLDKQDEQSLIKALQHLQSNKQQTLPLVWADLLQTSSEIRQGFSANQGFIIGSDKDGLNQTLAALHYLEKLRTVPQANGFELESHLANIQQYQLPARLWRSQRLLSRNLQQTSRWLKDNEALIQCPGGKTTQELRYLRNVFQLFFIETIQPMASKLNHYHYKLNTVFTKLIQNELISPVLREQLVANTGHHFDHYQHVMKQHILFWQGLYKRCGLSPAG